MIWFCLWWINSHLKWKIENKRRNRFFSSFNLNRSRLNWMWRRVLFVDLLNQDICDEALNDLWSSHLKIEIRLNVTMYKIWIECRRWHCHWNNSILLFAQRDDRWQFTSSLTMWVLGIVLSGDLFLLSFELVLRCQVNSRGICVSCFRIKCGSHQSYFCSDFENLRHSRPAKRTCYKNFVRKDKISNLFSSLTVWGWNQPQPHTSLPPITKSIDISMRSIRRHFVCSSSSSMYVRNA